MAPAKVIVIRVTVLFTTVVAIYLLVEFIIRSALMTKPCLEQDDRPCAARLIQGKSVVCVCNATYCDDITRQKLMSGRFVTYTSSEAGSRFKKQYGEFRSSHVGVGDEPYYLMLEIDPQRKHQTIKGFGGAVTDAAGIHWASLDARLRANLVNSYFGKNGIEYNMLRVPIGGCDFSTHFYTYNDLPWNDGKLTNFSLAPEDFKYKIPMIQQIKDAATADVHILAAVWSPPSWMKTNEQPTGIGELKPEFYQSYADYIAKFVREYKKHGVDVWGVSTTNEPIVSFVPQVRFQKLGWTPSTMGKWIVENLGPTIRNASDLKHLNIMAVDDMRLTIPISFSLMVKEYPGVLGWIDGVAVHWYADMVSPPALLELVTKNYPNKFVINTEACQGPYPWQKDKVSLGDWSRAQSYTDDIMQDLNYNLVGWIDWNLCLDKDGGPNWVNNFVDSPIIVYAERQEFVKQPMFFAMGHFAKWIPRGSVRIHVEQHKGSLEKSLDHVAFLTPRKSIVLVVQNKGAAQDVRVQIGEEHAVVSLEAASVTTLEVPYGDIADDA